MIDRLVKSVVLAVSALIGSHAGATVLTIGTGWQDDNIFVESAPSEKSAWTFTVSHAAILSIVDGFMDGDTYGVSGDLNGTTIFYAGLTTDVQAGGAYGENWTDAAFSRYTRLVGPGSYNFSVVGQSLSGVPAGFGLRLDAAPVPEPAAWMTIVGGFGLLGGAMRRRQPFAARRC